MRRLLFALMAWVALGAAGHVDFVHMVTATAEGGYRMGSPSARVKIVEYGSLTCPHCRDFHAEAATPLETVYVARGLVSYEYRSLILNGPDIAVAVLARCDGAPAFFDRVDLFYRNQRTWLDPFFALGEADFQRVQAAPKEQQLGIYASAAKLDTFVAAHGITASHFNQCLGNSALADKLAQIGRDANQAGVNATPTFFLNGKRQSVNTWTGLEPAIRAVLKLKPKAG